MSRPLLVGGLVTAVVALVASAAVAVASLGGPAPGLAARTSMMLGGGQSQGAGMGGGSMMGGSMTGGSMTGGSMMSPTGGMGMGMGMGMGIGMGTGGTGMAWLPGDGVAVASIPAARARAARAAAPVGLHPGEVMWFDNGFYVELKDRAGRPATEVIVDPRTGSVATEPGPAMMWNTRFGMHGGGAAAVAGSIDAAKARGIASAWLAAEKPLTTIGNIDTYPGYLTVDLRRNGAVSGMLSVSAGTGAVWYHTWHGAFIAMQDS